MKRLTDEDRAQRRLDKIKYLAEYRLINKDVLAAKKAAKYLENKEIVIKKVRAWSLANKEKTRASSSKWCKANREQRNKAAAINVRNNPARNNAKTARNRATKLRATTKWANDFIIKEIYHLASIRTKLTGLRWHVDHVVPLKSKFVCGLHCEANLRVIPSTANLAKSNRFWPDMPS